MSFGNVKSSTQPVNFEPIDFSKPRAVEGDRISLVTGKVHLWAKEVKEPKSLKDYLIHFVRYFTCFVVMVPDKDKHGFPVYKPYYLEISDISSKLNLHESYIRVIAKNPLALDQLDAIAIIRSGAPIRKVSGNKMKMSTLIRDVVYLRNNLSFKIGDKATGQRFFMQRKGNFKYLYTAQKIGAGAFGKVYELESRRGVQTPQVAKKVKKKISVDPDAKPHVREALKKSDAKHKRTAELSVVNEFEVLRDLNPDGKIVGIVECPSNPSGGVYYAHRYKDNIRKLDYEAFDSLPKSNRLELVFQLVQGLQYLHEKGYVHGDIKPENCLYDVNAEGVLNQMVLADFGGVRPVKEWGFGLVPAGTTVYRDPDFRSETNQLLNDKRQDFFRANDVYALSLTICNVLIPNHVKGKLPEDELLELGYSKQVVDALLSAMVDYKERPNIDTFAKEFRKAIAAQKQLDANHV